MWVAVGVGVGVGLCGGVTVAVGVGVGGGPDCAQYLPPSLKRLLLYPPHMIISLPVQTAVWECRRVGALFVLVARQVSVPGVYLPPVLKLVPPPPVTPPHTIISVSLHTAV